MKSQYERAGSWSKAVGGYTPGSEHIPVWHIWAIAVVVMIAFLGVLPAVGYMAGY